VTAPADPGPLLSLTDMARNLGVSYDRLRGFVEALGADLHPMRGRGKGFRYLPETQDTLQALLEAQDRGEVTPRTATAWLKTHPERNGTAESSPLTAESFALALRETLPPLDDKLLTLKEAHAAYGVPYRALRTLPRRFGKIRKTDVLRLIAGDG
jgi:hypothetical protein